MKHYSILLPSLAFILLLIVAGCVSPNSNQPIPNPNGSNGEETPLPSSGWMMYSPVQADTNPWQVYQPGLNGSKSEIEQVKAWLEGNGINATHYGFIPSADVVCAALNCPRGDQLIIQPLDIKASTFLQTSGFSSFNGVGVFAHAEGGDSTSYMITLVNASGETIYYGGCNEYIPFLITDAGEIPGPLKQCVWEGIPSTLENANAHELMFNPASDGEYVIELGYSVGCVPGKPVSEAECQSGNTIRSLPFDVDVFSASKFVKMQYEITQCRTNPWQEPESTATPEEDLVDFKEWLYTNDVNPTSIQYIPPVEGQAVCLACSCGQGDYYTIIIPANQQDEAEDLGFTYLGTHVPAQDIPTFSDAQWYVITPYQCYANKWNVEKKPIHSAAMDIAVMNEWLESKGVKVEYLTHIAGFTLTKECLKKATDAYGVGVLDDESAVLLQSLGFVPAGKGQLAAFTDTTNEEPLTLIYKSKFCALPPWGQPELSNGNEASASVEAAEWLAGKGIELYSGPTIHATTPSPSGGCDTDSGLALKVTVPAWTKPHLLATGFTVPPYTFDAQNEQVYPVMEDEAETE